MGDEADTTRRRSPGLATIGAGVVLAGALLLVGCGGGSSGPGVAQAGTPTTRKASSSRSTKASTLAFSQCMRAHGVPDFPDPNANGQLLLQGGNGSDLNPSSPQFQSAQNDCKSLAPGGVKAGNRSLTRGNALKFSECMRKHGITNFPDPNAQGALTIQGGAGSGLDPQTPQFQSAQNACFHYLGVKGAPPKPVTGGAPGGSGSGAATGGGSS